jgi:hypothetical protein
MSRNLGDTSCRICNRHVVLCSVPAYITPEQAGPYFTEYQGMIVANAVCSYCDAKYLAWVERAKWSRGSDDTQPFIDLSFRKAFNDEPAPEDLPTPEMLLRVHLEQCAADINGIQVKLNEATTEIAARMSSPPFWEAYRR